MVTRSVGPSKVEVLREFRALDRWLARREDVNGNRRI
jgi:hypothetical protein